MLWARWLALVYSNLSRLQPNQLVYDLQLSGWQHPSRGYGLGASLDLTATFMC